MRARRIALIALVATAPAAPAATAATAATGGTSPEQLALALHPETTGGTQYGAKVTPPKPKRVHRRASGPVAAAFSVNRSVAYVDGAALRFGFRIDGGSSTVHVRIALRPLAARTPILRLDLGQQPTGRDVVYRWRPTSLVTLPEGDYVVRLLATDARRRSLRPSAKVATRAGLSIHRARFPIAGPHDYGGPDARFGAPRKGHSHQGQDVLAAEGTPLVAVRGGRVIWRGYQADGAGYYLVIHGDGEDRDYVYMHLKQDSLLVEQDDVVHTGQLIAQVGSTGAAQGAHLHFEIWVGGWYSGGHPIDPLPELQRWDAYS